MSSTDSVNYQIDVQNATGTSLPLSTEVIYQIATLALRDFEPEAELTIRLVTPEEMTHLNHTYRKQNKTTNVLAFPSALPTEIKLECPFIGDIIICPEVLLTESNDLNKTLESHWALIVIHGILHLLGYDHIKDEEAVLMQAIEIRLLKELGFTNPYDAEDN